MSNIRETFIQCKDGKAKTGMAVDAGNFHLSRSVAKDKMLEVVKFSCRTSGDVNNSSFIKTFYKANDIPWR